VIEKLLKHKSLTVAAFVLPLLAFVLIIIVYPIFDLFWLSLSDATLAQPFNRAFVGLRNFVKFVQDPVTLSSLKYTFIFIFSAVGVQLPLGLGLALLLSSSLINKGYRYIPLFVLPLAIAPVITALFWRILLHNQFGLVNFLLNRIGLNPIMWWGNPSLTPFTLIIIDTWRWTPFVLLILYAGLTSIPKTLLEAAQVDGASGFQVLRHIKLPMIKKHIFVAVLLRFVLAQKKVFDIISATTGGGPGRATETLNFRIYKVMFSEFDLGYTAALSIVLLVIIISVTQPVVRRIWGRDES
jgi:multiple sugar transport system permease protein